MKQDTMRYVLGASDQEIERLDRQSASIEPATRLLLRTAGIAPGMRVLDLGTGVGHVATLIADLVGPEGRVIGIDSNVRLLEGEFRAVCCHQGRTAPAGNFKS